MLGVRGEGSVKDIHVQFAGIEKAPGEPLSIIYTSGQRQVLLAGRKYRIVIDGLGYEGYDERSEGGKKKEVKP